ncbi:heat-shock protein, partial [Trifolium medium]|nr:heat-shock protein [Trifolium medium]
VITELSSKTSVEVDLDLGYGSKICKVVTRQEFEDVNKEVFKNINDVIIVGGCCNIPMVKNLVTKICKGKEIYKGMNPLIAILCGAAAVAGVVDDAIGNMDLFTSQVTLHAIGIRVDGQKSIPAIPRNTSVPTAWDIVFSTINDNQTTTLIVVYKGDEEGQKAEENKVLGNFKITEIPKAPKGVPEITVSMTIDHRPSDQQSAIPVIEERMTKFDDGQNGWR